MVDVVGALLSLDPPQFSAVSSGAEGRMTSWAGIFQVRSLLRAAHASGGG
jgi:hypothetical protein